MEAMVVVSILSIIALIAGNSFASYKKRSKAVEAPLAMRTLFDATMTHYLQKQEKEQRLSKRAKRKSDRYPFPFLRTKPEGKRQKWFRPMPGKKARLVCFKPKIKNSNKWSPYVDCETLGISTATPTYYVYQIASDPYWRDRPRPLRARRKLDTFRISIRGDVDGDGVYGLFERSGGITRKTKELYQDSGVYTVNPGE